MENLRTFADQLWKYIVPKIDSKFASNVSYFRAQVVSNLGNNKLEVQRPLENGTLTLPCVRAMSGAQAGQQVVALVMGSLSNAIIVGDGKLNVPGGGGDAGIANFQAKPDGSLVITLTDGTTFTATPVINAFANVKVGSTTISADNNADTLTLVGDGLVNLTGDATNDSVTIFVDPNHTHTSDAVTDLVTATKYGPSGLVSFNGKEGLPLKSCIVGIEPAQSGSGNPTPANVRPISGREHVKVWRFGKNFFPQADVTFEVHEGNKTVYFPHPLPAGNYTLSADLTSTFDGNCLVHIIRGDGTSIQFSLPPGTRVSASFTSAGGNEIIGIRFYIGDGYNTSYNNSGAWSNIQVETGSTATAYEASETVVDADLPELVYGGTLDVLTGKLTVTHGYIKPTEYTGSDEYDTITVVFARIPLGKRVKSYNIVSNVATGATQNDANIARYGYVVRQGISRLDGQPLLFISASTTAHPTTASLSQALLDADACFTYVLETPEVYQLTPSQVASLAGQNHIWADTGNITVEYGAFLLALGKADENLKMYIDGHYVTAGQKSGTTLGQNATAEGRDTTASGNSSHAEGSGAIASNAHTHAEGYYTTASGNASHSEGNETVASGDNSHSEGVHTTASGDHSHAEGYYTTASGKYSHAEGNQTIAAGEAQHVCGRFNVSNTTSVEIVGWGTSSTRKNIRTLSTTGNEWIAGTLTQASDARLKDVQGEIPDLSSIRAIRFRWKNGDDKEHLGYLAQDVEELAPYLVGIDSNGYKSLDYIALLTAKVEMLEREIEKLKGNTRN